jgi:hypothetical protein
MADSILVATAKGIVSALETERDSGSGFNGINFSVDWDFLGREHDEELEEDATQVKVFVPREYDEALPQDRTGLAYVATFDVELRRKIGTAGQDQDQQAERDDLSGLVRMLETIHAYFLGTLSERRITLTDLGMIAEWIGERSEVAASSKIVHAYSVERLAQHREYYGLCREVFEITPGTA